MRHKGSLLKRTSQKVTLVFTGEPVEDGGLVLLGEFLDTEEETVYYVAGDVMKSAPYDCVEIITVDVPLRRGR
jgi:hypothetical protein